MGELCPIHPPVPQNMTSLGNEVLTEVLRYDEVTLQYCRSLTHQDSILMKRELDIDHTRAHGGHPAS